jgi:hypothetical protein
MQFLYRAAQALVSTARFLTAAWYLTIAILLFCLAFWLVWPIGQSWSWNGLAILVAFWGAAASIKAAEVS